MGSPSTICGALFVDVDVLTSSASDLVSVLPAEGKSLFCLFQCVLLVSEAQKKKNVCSETYNLLNRFTLGVHA